MTTADYHDKTPDHVFIGVYAAPFRRLVRELGLTRAETAALLLLGLRADKNLTCFPSRTDSAHSIGMKSGRWTRQLHKQLVEKKAIQISYEHDKRTPLFKLPPVFFYGRDSYQDPNSAQGTDPKSAQRRDPKSAQGDGYYSTPQQYPSEEKPKRTKTTPQQTGPDSLKKGGASELPLLRKDQRPTLLSLSKAGVSDLEAYLISIQYRPETIAKAIADSTGPNIRNRGAWIRRAIEQIAGEDLNYPALPKGQMRAAAAMAVVAANANRYLADPYFDNAQPGERNADGDTDNGSADYSPDQGEHTDYRQAQNYNADGDPMDSHLPF